MINFLKGVMWGLIILSALLASLRGLWWLFPAVVFVGWIVDRVAKSIFQGDEPQ